MPHPRFSNKEIAQRGEELYEQSIRTRVEDKYDGKIVVMDIETGDYEIDADALRASRDLLSRHPGAAIYAVRIGYDTIYSFNGGPRRVKR